MISTGAIAIIVFGILVGLFMLFTFIGSQNESSQELIQENYKIIQSDNNHQVSTCGYGEILGAEDMKCHPKCGNDGYCDERDVCFEGECYAKPTSAIECFDEVDEKYEIYYENIYDILEDGNLNSQSKLINIISQWNNFAGLGDSCQTKIKNNADLLESMGYNAYNHIEWYEDVVESNKKFFRKFEESLQ